MILVFATSTDDLAEKNQQMHAQWDSHLHAASTAFRKETHVFPYRVNSHMELCHTNTIRGINKWSLLLWHSYYTRFQMIHTYTETTMVCHLHSNYFPNSSTLFDGINLTIHNPNRIRTWFLFILCRATKKSSDQRFICWY